MEERGRYRENNLRYVSSPRGVKASISPGTRPKAKEVGMFMSMPSNNRQFQQPHEQRPNTPEWVMAESPVVTTSTSHNTVGGLSAPTRPISASSSLQSKIAARRLSLKSQRTKFNESRFGKARKNLSKTVQSLQVIRNDLEQTLSSGRRSVQSIATQTNDPDETAAENTPTAVGMFPRRTSRIPIPYEKPPPREKTPVRSSAATNTAEPSGGNYALSNVYSLMTISLSETKLEDICSSADLSVSVRPVLEAHESCNVLDVNILRLAEVKSKEVDVDRTLENWKPTTAVVSLVPEAKSKSTSKKSCVKRERSKDNKSLTDESQSASGKVPVVDLDKESFQTPLAKSKHSEKRSPQRRETTREEENGEEKHHDCSGPSGGNSCRVRFSPHPSALSAAALASHAREKISNTSNTAASPVNTVAAISKFPELLRRVTDQAITSIAKTVILGLPQQLSHYDLHPAASFSNHHSPTSSQSFAGNYRPFQPYSRVQPPMTVSTLNMHDESGNGYRFPSRNTSQLSVTSLINYPSNGGGGGVGAHLSGRYAYLAPHQRMSSNSIPKTRKELDNRYSHHHSQSGLWEGPAPKNSWVHDSSSLYSMHNGGYGSRPGSDASGSQFWLRYQKLKNPSGNWSTTSSSSSLYSPQKSPKYERPSQRFSVIRNRSGVQSSLDDLHNSTTNNQAVETGNSLHRAMGMERAMDNSTANTSFRENLYV